MTLHVTVAYDGGTGFTQEIQEWDYNTHGDLEVLAKNGESLVISSNSDYFISKEVSE